MIKDGDLIVIVVKERNPKTGRVEEVVSHGIDYTTGRTVVLSSDSPKLIGATFDADIGEYVLRADAGP